MVGHPSNSWASCYISKPNPIRRANADMGKCYGYMSDIDDDFICIAANWLD